MKSTDEPVVVTQVFDAPIAKVWQAITEKDQMKEWFFEEMTDFEPVVGFETKFLVEHGGQSYLHLWKLTEVIPQKKIVFDWRYEGIPGQGLVVWELEEQPDGTKLTLTNSAVETFPQDNPAFHRKSCEEGWNFLISELDWHLTEPDPD